MAEWSIASVLKTDVLRGTGGSNPSLSAERDVKASLFLFVNQRAIIRKLENQERTIQQKTSDIIPRMSIQGFHSHRHYKRLLLY